MKDLWPHIWGSKHASNTLRNVPTVSKSCILAMGGASAAIKAHIGQLACQLALPLC